MNKNKNSEIFFESNDQAISVESQVDHQLNETHFSLYNHENCLVEQFNKKNHNQENKIWFNYFDYDECENFYERPKNFKIFTQQFSSFRKSKPTPKANKSLVNLNENFELIDLTNDAI